jgi:hypothetical protein
MKKGANLPTGQNKYLNIDPRDGATNQEAVPVTWYAGTRMVALQWIMEPVNQLTRPAPDSRGKK